jgi:hypothetical protein
MTLKSALQDLKETTLAAISGLLGKLTYLGSLRRAQDRYEHWGMEALHGPDAAQRAIKTAHSEVLAGVLRTPLASLEKDLEESSGQNGTGAQEYVDQMRDRFDDLLPGERGQRKDAPAARHLSSVLLALSQLEKDRGRATPSTS